MTTVKIERAFIHLRSHIYLYIIHMTYKPFLYSYHKCVPVCIRNSLDSSMNKVQSESKLINGVAGKTTGHVILI